MLSNTDIKKKLKRGAISIFPFIIENIETANICVTASKFAWTLTDHKKIVVCENDKEIIRIPPQKTALIVTEEAIYLNETIAGTCHSRVDLTMRELGHIGTPMKPGRAQHLFITVYNQSDKDKEIRVGERIAVVMFHELFSTSNVPKSEVDHINLLASLLSDGYQMTTEDTAEFAKWTAYHHDGKKITEDMKASPEFQEFMNKMNKKLIHKGDIPLFITGFLLFAHIIAMAVFSDNTNHLTMIGITCAITLSLFMYFLGRKK